MFMGFRELGWCRFIFTLFRARRELPWLTGGIDGAAFFADDALSLALVGV
ncbi:MAG: hypothetical protein MPK06_01940 [Alphaproteobacteria bacterium]|nr:hypothetical protein [Alphaproteobacteria bacterium]MDA8005290.1 hypothetical protein [Alphaproteobacteria bacterium]MDA8012846.1 hypothetical protein [Alphaproteobacteria bacterium]